MLQQRSFPMYQTLVMPLKNGTQKDLKLGPDFRRDDEDGKFPERRQQGASAPCGEVAFRYH